MTAIDVTVVIPCLNEEDNVSPISAAVITQLSSEDLNYEIIFIDNGSDDHTVENIRAICRDNARVRLIINNKNYGQMRSPTHAVYQGRGRAVIGLCADFQDPPELIPEFIRRWRSGAEIVLGVRETERSSLLLKFLRFIGYTFFERFADYRVIRGATGFGLYDRRVVDALSSWREPEPFWRGMLVESGFHLETVVYKRPQRASGKSKNNVLKLIDFAITALGASSKKLLRSPIYFSVILMVLSFPTAMILFFNLIAGYPIGILLVLVILEVMFALNFFFLGVIGEQVRLIGQTVRSVPLVIERERVNFDDIVS
jgi:glycosyltransferase involved in cell wall biosynthesis